MTSSVLDNMLCPDCLAALGILSETARHVHLTSEEGEAPPGDEAGPSELTV